MNDRELTEKYAMSNPPDPDHPIIGATQVVERTSRLVTRETGDTAYLFDPAWSPDMWRLAQRTLHEMHQHFGDRIQAAEDGDTFLYYPCLPDLYVYPDAMERFSYMITTRVPLPHAVGERGCDVQLAPGGCSGQAVYLPHEHGPFVVVFAACRACDAWARETAETNFKLGARIDPGSPVPPTP